MGGIGAVVVGSGTELVENSSTGVGDPAPEVAQAAATHNTAVRDSLPAKRPSRAASSRFRRIRPVTYPAGPSPILGPGRVSDLATRWRVVPECSPCGVLDGRIIEHQAALALVPRARKARPNAVVGIGDHDAERHLRSRCSDGAVVDEGRRAAASGTAVLT